MILSSEMHELIVSADMHLLIIPSGKQVVIRDSKYISKLQLTIEVEAYAHVTYQGLQQIEGSIERTLHVILKGPDATLIFAQTCMLAGNSYYHCFVTQDHQAPDTKSSVNLQMVVDDVATAHYQGVIHIAESAVNSDASQIHKALVVSEEARVTSQPVLEVLTHQVSCSHGSAISTVKKEHVWYLASRGLCYEKARKLLIESFFALTKNN